MMTVVGAAEESKVGGVTPAAKDEPVGGVTPATGPKAKSDERSPWEGMTGEVSPWAGMTGQVVKAGIAMPATSPQRGRKRGKYSPADVREPWEQRRTRAQDVDSNVIVQSGDRENAVAMMNIRPVIPKVTE